MKTLASEHRIEIGIILLLVLAAFVWGPLSRVEWKVSENDRCLGHLEHDSVLTAMLHARVTVPYRLDEADAAALVCECATSGEGGAAGVFFDAEMLEHWYRWDYGQKIPFCIGDLQSSLTTNVRLTTEEP